MATIALEGHGATIAFGTTSYAADLLELTMPEKTRESIATWHQGTVDWMTFKPSEIADSGELQAVFDYNPSELDTAGLLEAAAETIIITLPNSQGTLSFTGFVTSLGGEQATQGERMQTSATIKVSGEITYAAVS